MDGRYKTLRESAQFATCREKCCSDCKRFDEVTRSAMIAIALSPNGSCVQVGKFNLYAIVTDKLGAPHRYRIYFQNVDKATIELLYIEPIP